MKFLKRKLSGSLILEDIGVTTIRLILAVALIMILIVLVTWFFPAISSWFKNIFTFIK